MATSTPMSFSLLFLSLILFLAPAIKAHIVLFSSGHSDGNSILTAKARRTRINGGETLTDGQMNMVAARDCSIFLYYKVVPHFPVFVLQSGLDTKDCSLYVSNRGVLYVHANDIKTADKAMFGEESEEGRYALVLHQATLAIYGPAIWSNGIREKQPSLMEEEQPSAISAAPDNIFYSGEMLEGSENGDVEVERMGHVAALLRPDCTLAVQKKSGKVLWSTYTDHTVQGQCKLELKSDGELVIRDYFSVVKEGKSVNRFVEVFNSGHKSRENSYVCLLWDDGEMMIYGRKDFIFKKLRPGAEMARQ